MGSSGFPSGSSGFPSGLLWVPSGFLWVLFWTQMRPPPGYSKLCNKRNDCNKRNALWGM